MLIIVLIVVTVLCWLSYCTLNRKMGYLNWITEIMNIIALIVTTITVMLTTVAVLNWFCMKLNYQTNVEIYDLLQARIENYNGYNDPYLLQDVQNWNKNIMKAQNMNESIWLGFSVPDSYENFETIPFDFLYQENQN